MSNPEYWKRERVASIANTVSLAIAAVLAAFAVDACRRHHDTEILSRPAAIEACRATCLPGQVHESAVDYCECK